MLWYGWLQLKQVQGNVTSDCFSAFQSHWPGILLNIAHPQEERCSSSVALLASERVVRMEKIGGVQLSRWVGCVQRLHENIK